MKHSRLVTVKSRSPLCEGRRPRRVAKTWNRWWMKYCPQCNSHKSKAEFYKNKAQRDGLTTQCKSCCKSNAATRRSEKPEVTRQEVRAAWARNGKQYDAKRAHTKAEWRKQNAEKLGAYSKEYRSANRPRLTAYRALARARKKQATPSWANQNYIALFYKMAQLESKRTGELVEVDHIVPMQSELVCGLHCEHNLQLLRRYENRAKCNRVWPDMP